ncbi:MAG: hypothetical protein FJY38_04440 [Betaproteobacteria bacterium]|jgi:hypothetical protein|nr:hypothetical protein [Betaproteobacteria bacterium]
MKPTLVSKTLMRLSALGIAAYVAYVIATKFTKLPFALGDLGEFFLVFISIGFFVVAILMNEKPGDEQE